MASTWLDKHLETFIRPYLGFIPPVDLSQHYIKGWTPHRIKALQAVWKQAKVRSVGRPIILAGRDVFLLEVMARLEDHPTVFRSDISAATVGLVKEDYSKFYCIDTGYRGSIPRTLKCYKWDLIQIYERTNRQEHQVFPRASQYGAVMALASALEGVPKYWTRAEPDSLVLPIEQRRIVQYVNTSEIFAKAAAITIHVGSTLLGIPRPGKKKSWVCISDERYYKLQGALS